MSPPGRKANCAGSSRLFACMIRPRRLDIILLINLPMMGPTEIGRMLSVLFIRPSFLGRPVTMLSFSVSGMSFAHRLNLIMSLSRLGAYSGVFVIFLDSESGGGGSPARVRSYRVCAVFLSVVSRFRSALVLGISVVQVVRHATLRSLGVIWSYPPAELSYELTLSSISSMSGVARLSLKHSKARLAIYFVFCVSIGAGVLCPIFRR